MGSLAKRMGRRRARARWEARPALSSEKRGAQVGKARPFDHILLSRFLVGDVSATETKWDVVRSSFRANLMRDTVASWPERKWSQIVTRLSQADTTAHCTLSPDRCQDAAQRRKLAG